MLTAEQIKRINNFCKDQEICFYDLRKEMVDHISTSIEAKVARQHYINFDYELSSAALTLNIDEFRKTLEEKEQIIERGVKKRQRKLFLDYFKWPHLIITLTLIVILMLPFFYMGLSTKDHIGLNGAVLGLVLVWILGERKKMKKPEEELLMFRVLINYVPSAYWWVAILLMARLLSNYTGAGWTNTIAFALLITVITVALILLSIAEITIYRKINRSARQNYPEIFVNL
jgi:magnesium-transporting ATPase (P-type)